MKIEACPGHRVGEWVGPVDWTFDFAAAGWDRGGSHNPLLIPAEVQRMRDVEAGLARGERWMVNAHGTARRIIKVGMYDGWPYWRPVPTYLTETWMGGEPMSWSMPSGAFRATGEK